MPNNIHRSRRPHGIAIVTDKDDGAKVEYDLPDTSDAKAGVVDMSKVQAGDGHGNGTIPEDEEEDIASKVGWKSQFGWPVESVLEGESPLDHATWVEENLPEYLFGGRLAKNSPISVGYQDSPASQIGIIMPP